MNQNHSRFITIGIAFALFLPPLPCLYAQQAPEGRKWIIQDPKYVTLTSAGIHIIPKDSKLGTVHLATALHLPASRPWQVAFEVQMGPMLDTSMSIHLLQGKTDVAWLGADSYYKALSAFIGSGNGNMPFSQPWDTKWHRFEYISDGKTLSLWHDGVRCGEGPLLGTPDTFEILDMQLELRLRGVEIRNTSKEAALKQSEQGTHANSSKRTTDPISISQIPVASPQPVKDDSHATLNETHRWICDTINKSAGTFYGNGVSRQSYTDAVFDGNNLSYSNRDDIYSLIDYETLIVPLDKMDPSRVDVSQFSATNDEEKLSYRVVVGTTNNIPIVSKRYKIVTNSEPDSLEKQEYATEATFFFNDMGLASRFAKAMRHAILLSTANPTKEPF